MPHQCTNCGRQFPDGSKEMLAGCPDCGGNKFQFRPKGRTATTGSATSAPSADARSGGTAGADGSSGTTADGREGPTVDTREGSTADSRVEPNADTHARSHLDPPPDVGPDDDIVEPDPPDDTGLGEDHAQTDARTDVVSRDELPDAPPPAAQPSDDGPHVGSADDGPVARPPGDEAPDDDRPDIAELREELNDQFESIRVLNPGQYELNLMELYDREEHIISLREDGRYVIEVPEAWRGGDSG